MRHLACVLAVLVLASTRAPAIAAQGEATGVADSAVRATDPPPHKSVALASLLGLALPGTGHWYAGETRRAGVIAGVYTASVVVVSIADPARSHEWNRAERAVGWLWLGCLAVGSIDGALAARRSNLHSTISVGSADAFHRTMQVGLSMNLF